MPHKQKRFLVKYENVVTKATKIIEITCFHKDTAEKLGRYELPGRKTHWCVLESTAV